MEKHLSFGISSGISRPCGRGTSRALAALIFASLFLSGCGPERRTVGLDVDVFLHPSSSDLTDVLLQTGITKRLEADADTRLGIIHVRVVNGMVVLSGAVGSARAKDRAEQIARETVLTLNGEEIKATTPISNLIEVQS